MKRPLVLFLALIAVVALAWRPVHQYLIIQFGVSELTVVRSVLMQRLGLAKAEASHPAPLDQGHPPAPVAVDHSIAGFQEIGERLGTRGRGTNMITARGAVLFDANGDGRLDLYLPHNQRPVAMRTPENVLTREPVLAQPSVLFLNQGNGPDGLPQFESIQDRQLRGNDQFVREELLIEGKYRPRGDISEDENGPGRIAWGAISADFDGDGRLDLYVLNGHHGLLMQTHELGMRVYPAPDSLGRQAHTEPLVIRQPSFLWGTRDDGMHTMVEFGEQPEYEGRNSLYLNRGDQDGDGLPEWEDATERAAVGGRWASTSAAVADIDRDGDLDLYVANFLDPDFWGFGDDRFAGQRNQLYLNQLVETGSLHFRDASDAFSVAGLHQEEGLAATMFVPGEGKFVDIGEQVVDGEIVGERADHSWAAHFTDWNDDGWPDLLVANDIGNRLRVYQNRAGHAFVQLPEFEDPIWDGCWMGMSSGDLDGDLKEDIFLTNCGSQVMSVRNTALLVQGREETNVQALSVINYPAGKSTLHHEVLSYDDDSGFRARATDATLIPSPILPPDLSQPINFARAHRDLFERYRFGTSLTAIEFAFNSPMFDVDNDGDLDLYLAGSLLRGNDGFIGDWSGSPGRMLVNESLPGELIFRDRTLEYRLLDITHMDYDANPPRREAPGVNWHKRDTIYVTDTDSYSGMGLDATDSITRDLYRMHEAANCVLAGDLNGDGFDDVVVTHSGGYNSLSPDARNLKVEVAGRTVAVPAPNKVMKPPSGFEGGPTFVFINPGPPAQAASHWFKIRLRDATSHNRFGVGAKVVVNGRVARTMRATSGAAFGAVHQDVTIGLGPDLPDTVEITWPDRDLASQRVDLAGVAVGKLVCIDRETGIVPCAPPPV